MNFLTVTWLIYPITNSTVTKPMIIAWLDRKMLNTLNGAYEVLHLLGYYDGITDALVVKRGFENACILIDKIKPAEHA